MASMGIIDNISLNSGLSTDIEDDPYPIPEFNDKQHLRYKKLLELKLNDGDLLSDLNLGAEAGSVTVSKFDTMASIIRSIIELDEVEPFFSYLTYTKDGLFSEFEDLKESSRVETIKMNESIEGIMYKIRVIKDDLEKCAGNLRSISKIIKDRDMMISEVKNFTTRVDESLHIMLELKELICMLMNVEAIINNKSYLFSIRLISDLKRTLQDLFLPKEIEDIISTVLNALEEKILSYCSDDLKNFVIGSQEICRDIAEILLKITDESEYEFYEKLKPCCYVKRGENRIYYKEKGALNSRCEVEQYNINIFPVLEAINVYKYKKNAIIFLSIYTDNERDVFNEEISKLKTIENDSVRREYFIYLMHYISGTIIKDYEVQRYLERIKYDFEIEPLVKCMITELINIAVNEITWENSDSKGIERVIKESIIMEQLFRECGLKEVSLRGLTVLCADVYSVQEKKVIEKQLSSIMSQRSNWKKPYVENKEEEKEDYTWDLSGTKEWKFPLALDCFELIEGTRNKTEKLYVGESETMKHITTHMMESIENTFLNQIKEHVLGKEAAITLPEAARTLVDLYGLSHTMKTEGAMWGVEGIKKMMDGIEDMTSKARGSFNKLLEEKINLLTDMVISTMRENIDEAWETRLNAQSSTMLCVENFMIEMLVRLNPIASEIKLEICKKVAEGWFKGIIISLTSEIYQSISMQTIDMVYMDSQNIYNLFIVENPIDSTRAIIPAERIAGNILKIMKMLRTHEAEYLKDCSTDNSSGVNMLYGYNVKLLGVILKKLKNSIIGNNPDDEEFLRLKKIDYILSLVETPLPLHMDV